MLTQQPVPSMGIEYADFLTKTINDLNILTEEQIWMEMQLAKNEQRNCFYFQHRLANGQIRDIEVFSGPIIYQDQKLLYFIIHDITEHNKTALKETENKERASGFFEQTVLALMKDSGFDRELSEGLVDEFCKQAKKIIREVENDLENDACPKAGFLLHKLKGSAGSVRVSEVFRLALESEELLHLGEREEVKLLLGKIERVLQDLSSRR